MEVGVPNKSVWLSELSVWSWSCWNDEITLVDLGGLRACWQCV